MNRPSFCVVTWAPTHSTAAERAHAAAGIARASGMSRIATGSCFEILSSRPVSWFTLTTGGRVPVIGEAFGNRLIPHSLPAPSSSLDRVDAPSVAREMVRTIWGGYAAVLCGADGISLLADPSGALPHATIVADGVAVATDDLTPAICRAIGFEMRIDWTSLVTTLVAPAAAVHLPHLMGLRPGIAGRLQPLDTQGADTVIWSPSAYARTNDWSDAAVCEAVDRSTGKLGTTASAVQLSGGLDSSIVHSSLCRDGRIAPAINYATKAAGGDERRYAAQVAERYASPLTACDATRLPSYEPLFRKEPSSHPFVYGLDDAFEDAVASAARQVGCDRLLTGQGGDAVFFQPATPLVAVDRLRAFGYDWKSYRALLDDARRTRSSIWHHLLPAIADRIRPAAVPTQRVAEQLLTPTARALVGKTVPNHPWLADAHDLPPGKRMHLVMLANSQIFHARRPDPQGIELRHPLLTQPVLEAVLAIPSYALAVGDNDRGLARRVFANRLPASVVWRRGKGDAADHYSRAALANLSFLRDMLLDGVLVREGLVDREALAVVLTREHLFYSLDYRALALHATCEAWARYWSLS